MKRNGKEVTKILVVDNSKNGEVVVEMCDTSIKCTNGYEVKVEYATQEVCE